MSAIRGTDHSHSLVVHGDPASCHRTARALERLTASLEDGAGFLTGQVEGEGTGGPAGRWVAAYRAQCRRLTAQATDLALRTDVLATALGMLAEALERAQEVLLSVEWSAAPHGLVVDRRLVPPATPDRGAAAWTAWRDALVLVRMARRIERDARHAWERALERPADGPAPPEPAPPPPPPTPLPPTPCPAPEPPSPTRPPRHPGPPRSGQGPRVPDLDPVTCGLTPQDPDTFCATPGEPLTPYRPEGARHAGR